MEDLAKLSKVNVKKNEELPGFGLNYTMSKPSEDSMLFRVELTRPSSFSISSAIIKSLIVACVAVTFTLLGKIPHEDLRLVATVALWIAGAVAWLLHSKLESEAVVAESVLAVRGLGLQIFSETKGGEIRDLVFIEAHNIREILIVEGFTAMKVITYIGIELISVHQKKPALVLPFQHFELPIACLVEVTKGLRETIDLGVAQKSSSN